MRRMLLSEEGPVEKGLLKPDETETPSPGRGQVLLDVLACGVCHTDLHLAEGDVHAALPRVLGHQVVGRIAAIGEGVNGLSRGQRVGVGWPGSACGDCRYCRSGRENLCERALFTGRDLDGGYADALVARADFVFPLPASFTDAEAAPLLCAGIIGYRALRLSEVRPGQVLGLYGFGASAHIALQVARAWGCPTFVFTRSEEHRRLALELGAAWTGGAEDDPGVELDAAVSFAPAGWIVPSALQRLARGATLAVNAVHASEIPAFEYDRLYWERTVRSVANFTRDDARDFLSLASSLKLQIAVETMPLSRANEALVRLKRSEVRGALVLVPEDRQR